MSSLDINTKKNSANILQDLKGAKILVQEARFSNGDRLEEWTGEGIDKNNFGIKVDGEVFKPTKVEEINTLIIKKFAEIFSNPERFGNELDCANAIAYILNTQKEKILYMFNCTNNTNKEEIKTGDIVFFQNNINSEYHLGISLNNKFSILSKMSNGPFSVTETEELINFYGSDGIKILKPKDIINHQFTGDESIFNGPYKKRKTYDR